MKKILIGMCVVAVGILIATTGVQAEETVNSVPVIHLLGSNPTTIIAGDPIPNLGVWVYDMVDGDITKNLAVTSEAVNAQSGTYRLTYTAVNSQGVEAAPAVRTVQFVGRGGGSGYIAPSGTASISEPQPVTLVDRSPTVVVAPVVSDIVLDPEFEEDKTASDIDDEKESAISKLAALAFATMPQTTSDVLTCIFLLLLVLALIYIGANIVVNSQDISKLSESDIRKRKIIYFAIGDIIGLVVSYYLSILCLIVPLSVILVLLVLWFVWYRAYVAPRPVAPVIVPPRMPEKPFNQVKNDKK